MTTDLHTLKRQRARLTRQGQITVPKVIRDALGARPGDDFEFIARGAKVFIEVRPRRSVLDFAGIASGSASKIPATAEALDDVIRRGMAEAAVARTLGKPRPRRPK
jgi:antitoxin PrlF